jgi:hypothetical protein
MAKQNSDVLFAHLVASNPVRERKAAAWLIAGAINAGAVAALIVTSSATRDRAPSRVVTTIVPVSDAPVILAMPVAEAPVANAASAPASSSPGATAPTTPINSSAEPAPPSLQGTLPGATKMASERLTLPDALPRARSSTLPPPTPLDEVRARINVQIGSINDSIAGEEAARAKAKDWTIGKSGNRWGIAPGGIHLGKLTPRLAVATNNGPVPDIIVPPPGRRDEGVARMRSWQEIEAGAARAERQSVFEQRVKSIRSRVDTARTATSKNK